MGKKVFQKVKRCIAGIVALGVIIISLSNYVLADVSAISVSSINVNFTIDPAIELYGLYELDHYVYHARVPLYVNISVSSPLITNRFLSGRVDLPNSILSMFTFSDSTGSSIAYSYFENYTKDIYINRPDLSNPRIVFDSWQIQPVSQLLGYLNFQFDTYSASTILRTVSGTTTFSLSSNVLYMTEYEFGFVNSVIYAIDHSTDIEQIIILLGTLDNDILNQVVPQLQNINGILGQIYNYLQTLNANQTQNFRQLVYALSGVDLSTTSSSNLSQTTYDRWVHLIYDAINYQEPNASEADQAANDLQSAHDQNDLAQDAAYQGMDSAMESIDFNVTVPQGIINAGLTIGNYIESIYSNLGSDLQFLITVTLTIGLITVIIGAINRYPRSPVTDSVSEVETSGIKNGKRVHSKTTTYRHTTRVRK